MFQNLKMEKMTGPSLMFNAMKIKIENTNNMIKKINLFTLK